jgi:hypothetical protein
MTNKDFTLYCEECGAYQDKGKFCPECGVELTKKLVKDLEEEFKALVAKEYPAIKKKLNEAKECLEAAERKSIAWGLPFTDPFSGQDYIPETFYTLHKGIDPVVASKEFPDLYDLQYDIECERTGWLSSSDRC